MSVHKKNMLEAFRNAGDSSSQPAGSAGPFASGSSGSSSRRSKKSKSKTPRSSLPGVDLSDVRALGVPAVPAWLPWVAGVAFAFVLGISLGRASMQSAVAAEGDESVESDEVAAETGSRPFAPSEPRSTPPASSTKSEEGTATSPLFDKANRYTVVAATYGTSRADFAWATHDQLVDAGLPVFPPIERGRNIVVVVGAAPTSSELSLALEKLHGLTGWDGGRDAYADAYVDQIDRLLER